MMVSLMISLSTLSSIFMFLNHPLSFGMVLLMQTILISLITGMMNLNFWFSYILFLIMIGGMLILFIYMTSIASNEKFKFSYKLLMLTFIMMLIMTFLLMIIDLYYLNFSLFMYDNMKQMTMTNNNLSMNKYVNYPTNLVFFMIIIYLLITLIMVVKITNLNYGPLRQKF
nr:NADH dehydrogenase subunit 6 [Arhopalus rusticus]